MAPDPSSHPTSPGESNSNPTLLLRDLGLLDLLEHDPRLTFVLDATDAHNHGPGVRILYRNDALAAAGLSGFWDDIDWPLETKRDGGEDAVSQSQFLHWTLDPNPTSHSYSHHAHDWRRCLVAKRWIVVSGSPSEAWNRLRNEDGGALSKKSSRSKFTTFDWTDDPPPAKMSAHVTWARGIDWTNTPLGPMKGWSPQLRSNASLIMQDPRPAVGFYGSELIMIYNEAYIELLGGLHPCMGRSAREVLVAVWDSHFEPIIERNLAGETAHNANTEILLIRNGYAEETYFSIRFIPIFNSEGATIGHYEPVVETVSPGRFLRSVDCWNSRSTETYATHARFLSRGIGGGISSNDCTCR